jgi:hypothetical protein
MEDDYGRRAARILGKLETNVREGQGTNMPSPSSTPLFPGTLPSDVMHPFRNSDLSAPPHDLQNAGTRAVLSPSEAESRSDLQPHSSSFPAAQSMPSLEQQLASLIKEEQRRTLPWTVEQQLASFIEEQQGRRDSFQNSSFIPLGRALSMDHVQASLTDHQQVRHQPFQAPNNALERMPTSIEQLLASLNDGRGSFQATSSDQNNASTIDEHLASLQQGRTGDFQDRRMPSFEQLLASLNDEHQRRHGPFQATSSLPNSSSILDHQGYRGLSQGMLPTVDQQGYRSSSQDMQPTIEQLLASLIQTADFASSSNVLPDHQLPLPLSPEHLHRLGQLQRDFAPQAQPDIQTQAAGCNAGTTCEGHRVNPLPTGVPREFPVAMPAPYGNQETFPGKLYCLLAEAEKDGNDQIISFTPDGRAFKIHNRQAFIEEVSPKHFRHTHITSFVRQLNFYGFKRQPKGPNRGGFAHPFFLRGHPELLVEIEKKEVKQRAKKGR